MNEKIVVTTDFSECAHIAFATAAGLAREQGAQIILVHAAPELPPFLAEGFDMPRETYWARLMERLGEESTREEFEGLHVETRLLPGGDGPTAIADFADKENAALVVSSSHGHTGWSRFLLGSFAEHLVRLSKVPVLTCRERKDDPESSTEKPRVALVPYDFSRNSAAVFPAVRSLAERYGTRFVFVHVVEERHPVVFGFGGAAELPVDIEADLERRELREELAFGSVRDRELPNVEAKFEVRQGVPYAEIVASAREERADLILQTTHGRTGLDRFLVGSVAERVLRHAPCSVLTVRPTVVEASSLDPATKEVHSPTK